MNESKATRYQRLRRRASVVEVASGAAAMSVVALTPVAGRLAIWAEGIGGGSRALAVVCFIGAVVATWWVAGLPARVFAGLHLDGRYSGAAPPVAVVAAGELQVAVVGLSVALLVAGTAGAAVWLAPAWWWALSGTALGAALAAAVRAMPMALARFTSAAGRARPALEQRLTDLAGRAGVPVASIDVVGFQQPGSPAAFVTGAGRTRRIFLSDELIRDWSDDEIAVVVAHELGHHARHDLIRAVGLSAVTLTVGLWAADAVLRSAGPWLNLGGPETLGSWPLLAVVAGAVWLAATPVRHGQSRRHERLADEFALTLTGEAEAFTSAIRRLGARHLAEERPTALTRWFFHRHPPVGERLALASRFRTP